ncbi:glucarate dehydratase, partial [Singulisphaera rosea]
PDDADIIEGPKLAIRGGMMAVPEGPGLGVSLDRDKLARAHEVFKKCGMRDREDATLMRKLEPGWTGELL